MAKKTLADLGDLTGKKVLIRVDFNVPLDKNQRRNQERPPDSRGDPDDQGPAQGGASVVAMSHLGRPSGDAAKDKLLTMDKVVERLADLLDKPVTKAGSTVVGSMVTASVAAMKPGDVVMLENVRFDPREQKNDPEFAAAIAGLADAYVNDAFGTCHNDKDASMVAVPAALKAAGKPRAVGLLVAKELEIIDGLMSAPKKPVLAVMGGAKVSDKIAFINVLLTKVDHLLIGGKMAYTFLKAKGVDVGSTQVAAEELAAAQPLLQFVGSKITLPVDCLAAKSDDLNVTKEFAGPIDAGYRGRGHRPEDARPVRRNDQSLGYGDLERTRRLVRKTRVQHGHEGRGPGDGRERRGHDHRRRRDGRGRGTVRLRHEDDPRQHGRRGVPRVRRGEAIPVAGPDRRKIVVARGT